MAGACEMKAIHKRLDKLEMRLEAEAQRRAPSVGDLLRWRRFDAVRAAKGLPPLAPPVADTRRRTVSEILRERYAKAGKVFPGDKH